MEFAKYSSLSNHYKQGILDRFRRQGLTEGTWVAMEKIHGANFSFWYDGSNLKFARRRDFLAEGENFMGIQNLLPEITPKIKNAYNHLCNQGIIKRGVEVVFYGELCGGLWFGTKASSHTSRVGKGKIWYSPREEFVGFDVRILDPENSRYLPWNEVSELYAEVGIDIPPQIAEGSFDSLVKMNNVFPTRLGIQLGYQLPPGEEEQMAEGLVIRCKDKEVMYNTESRAIVKSVSSLHSEIGHKKKVKNVEMKLEEPQQEALDYIRSHITENRLITIISHEGELTWKTFPRISGLMRQDIFKEALVDHFEDDRSFKEHFGDNWKQVQRLVGTEVDNLIREFIKKEM